MIINTSGPVRDLESSQSTSEKRAKGGDSSALSKLSPDVMPDDALSPQAQLVQHMIDAWQSKDGTLSGKVLTALESTEQQDKAVLIDVMQTLEQHEPRAVPSADPGGAVEYDASQLKEFNALLDQVEPEGLDRQGVNRLLSEAIDQLATHEPLATRDIVSPQFIPPPEMNKDVIPVDIPELRGIVSEACFEFAPMPSLIAGGFEPLAA